MFEVRCFHLGKVKGLFLGQGLFLEVPQIPGCCSGGLPSHIWKVGAKNRAGEGSRPPRLAAFALTTGFTLDTYLFPARAWTSHGACSDWLCSGSRGSRVCCMW